LKQHIARLRGRRGNRTGKMARRLSECADVLNYWPEAEEEKEFGPLRWVAIRIRKRQGDLFGDGSEANILPWSPTCGTGRPGGFWSGHREKAGTIEAIHEC